MSALKIARIALLASFAVYVAAIIFSMSGTDPHLPFLISLVAIPGIALGALACVLLQIRAGLTRRPARTRSSR